MNLPSDAPKLPKWIFLIGDAALIATAWFIAHESPRPLTGMTLLALSACVIAGVVIGAFPFIADYSRRQEEALDDRQRSLHSLSVTVAASSEQIAIAATGLQGLAAAAQVNLEKSERISVQIQEKMTELQALLATGKKDDGDAATRLESVVKKINSSVAALEGASVRKDDADAAAKLESAAKKISSCVSALEAAVAKAAEAARAIPPAPIAAPEVPPVPASRIVKIKPAAAPSESPFDSPVRTGESPEAPAPAVEAPPSPVPAPDPEPATAPPAEATAAAEPSPAPEAAPAPAPAPRKRSPRKPAAPPAAAVPAPDLVLEPTPSPDAELPLASPAPEDTAPPEPAVSADGATRLIVTAYIGIGNRLFIRGEGPGLSWDKGIPLVLRLDRQVALGDQRRHVGREVQDLQERRDRMLGPRRALGGAGRPAGPHRFLLADGFALGVRSPRALPFEALQLGHHHPLVALGADGMADLGPRPLVDVALDLLPVVLVVPDFFAVRAHRHHLLEAMDLRRVPEDPLRDPQAHPEGRQVDRLRQEVVDPRLRGRAAVVSESALPGQEDEVDIFGLMLGAEAPAEVEAVQGRHLPVAHDHPRLFDQPGLPGLLAVDAPRSPDGRGAPGSGEGGGARLCRLRLRGLSWDSGPM